MVQRKLSILDFGPVDAALQLAPLAEDLGYHRYWLGEHHSRQQCANPILLGSLLAATCPHLHLGSGGVCLGHRNVLRLAEDARLIEHLLPGRFDLGVTQGLPLPPALHGALLGDRPAPDAARFARRVEELHGYLHSRLPADHPMADHPLPPADGCRLWVLDNRPPLVELAARLGVGLALSLYHDYTNRLTPAVVRRYRDAFQPGPGGAEPVVVLVVGGVCAETADEADRLYQEYLDTLGDLSAPRVQALLQRRIFRGDPETAAGEITAMVDGMGADEVMICDLLSHRFPARATLYRLLARALGLQPSAGRAEAVANEPPAEIPG